jgi:methionine synthase II (cobalamin-independent)
MEFEHSYHATGIGSLPHKNEKEAFRLILENFPTLPFWPQLPKRSFLEGMVVQYSEGFPSLKWDQREQKVWIDTSHGFDKEVERFYQWLEEGNLEPFRMTEDFSRGVRLVEDLASWNNRNQMGYIKGQIVGPITFGLSLTDPEQKPIFYDPTLRDILVKHLSSKARWMEKRFNDLLPGTKTIIFFDEPSLSSFGSAFSSLSREDVILSLNECFDAVKGLRGVHCCGNTDWGLLLETNLDILSFDAFGYLETVSLYPEKLRTFLERGGILAWGIVPTHEEDLLKENVESLVNRFKRGNETLLKKGLDRTLLRRAILTPSCGTAFLPIPLAERACQLTAAVSKRLRESETME